MNSKIIKENTIEELEGDYWKAPKNFPTPLTKNVFELRRIKIKELASNDIRLLISQNIGLKYLVPIAIERLKNNLLEESLYYPGDLLLAVLNLNNEYWMENLKQKEELTKAINKQNIASSNVINDEIRESLSQAIKKFV